MALSVRISGFEDSLLDNNVASGLVFTSGQPRVLLIDSNPRSVRELTWGLSEQDIVCDVRPPEGIPTSLSDIQSYEAVILSNVPATSLTTRQMEIIRTYVQDLGGGFLMLGGDQSFGLGGYALADSLFFVLEGKTGVLRVLDADADHYEELASFKLL